MRSLISISAIPGTALALALTALPLALIAMPAAAECVGPPTQGPVMPQGATATEAAMKEGRVALQAYVDLLQAYQVCLGKQIADAPPDTKPEIKAKWAADHDAAIDAALNLADIYAAQLRAFKSQGK